MADNNKYKNLAKLLKEAEELDMAEYEGYDSDLIHYLSFLGDIEERSKALVTKVIDAYYQDTKEYNTREQCESLRWESQPTTVDGLRPVTFIRNYVSK